MTLVYILMTLLLSWWQQLQLEKDIIVATVRAGVQLIVVGFILQWVFDQNRLVWILAVLFVMVTVAARNAAARGREIKGLFWPVFFTIAVAEVITVGLMLLLGIVQYAPETVIPISGMIVGNSMIVSGLYIHHMKQKVAEAIPEIEVLLSLGATKKQAIHRVMQQAVKASMIPSIDSMKTMGLVQLPGMMTGMIIAGASPIEAVKYQILIVFSINGAAALTSVMLSMLTYSLWFTKGLQVNKNAAPLT